MPYVAVYLDKADYLRLQAICDQVPVPAVLTLASLLREIARQGIADGSKMRKDAAAALFQRYMRVPMAVAAKAFRAMRGRVPLDELQSLACHGALEACHRFDPSLGFSPAPFLRQWAIGAIQSALRKAGSDPVREHQGEEGVEQLDNAEELARLISRFGTPLERRVIRSLMRGDEIENVQKKTGVQNIHLILVALAEYLSAHGYKVSPGKLVPAAQGAKKQGITQRALRKRLASGDLRGQRINGKWFALIDD